MTDSLSPSTPAEQISPHDRSVPDSGSVSETGEADPRTQDPAATAAGEHATLNRCETDCELGREKRTVIRVLILDDHVALRQALAFMINRHPDLEVVAQAGTIAEARRLLNDIDVAIVDLDLPDGFGMQIMPEFRAVNPDGHVLVFTASYDRTEMAESVAQGAGGVMHKSVPIGDVIDALHRLGEGRQLLTPNEIAGYLRHATHHREEVRDARSRIRSLTPREHDVLMALSDGLNDKEIAQRLFVSHETVRTHMMNILGKFGVNSRLQALIFAVRYGVVTIDTSLAPPA